MATRPERNGVVARLAYWFYAVAAAGPVIGQTWVAVTQVPWPPGVSGVLRVAAVLPFALCLELWRWRWLRWPTSGMRLGERAYGFRSFSTTVATVAVGILVAGHWPHLYWAGAFEVLSASAYALWLLHSAARRQCLDTGSSNCCDGHAALGDADGVETLPDNAVETGGAASMTRGAAPGRATRVFVSSTYGDLQDFRAGVRAALARLGLEDVAMETYTAEDRRPVERCVDDVRSSDLYVGVFAWRYGYVPAGYDESITELEYRAAVAANIDCLIFLLDEAAPWQPTKMDFGEPRARVLRLRQHLSATHVCDFFSTPDDLRTKVAEAVGRWMQTAGDTSAPVVAWDAWTAYKRRLVEEYGRLDLEALTPPEREEYLQIGLRAVFVEPSVREDLPPAELSKELLRKLQEATELAPTDVPHGLDRRSLERARETYRKHPARRAFEVLGSSGERTCVLLGDPGAGKSTLARFLMLALAEDEVHGPLESLTGWQPVLVELREYAASIERYETFLEYLDYRCRTDGLGLPADVFDAYLREQGRTLVVFDGLDELFDPRAREMVSRRIAGFAATYPDVRIVVTSRIVGYRPRVLRDAGFSHYTIQDLTTEQRDAFLSSWYALAMHDRPGAATQRHQRLTRAIEESAPIRELAGNPLLLTILAIIGKHQELPRERWKVYDHAAGVLVQHWDVNKHLIDRRVDADAIREDDKKELLRRIAYRMQHGRHGLAGNHVWEEDLAAEIEGYLAVRYQYDPAKAAAVASHMIDQFRARNFVLARFGPKIYGFVHRALLEFFCASEIVAQFEKTRTLTESDLTTGVFGRQWEDPSWTEVLRLIAGMVDATVASRIIDHLLTDARPTRSPVVDNPSLGAVSTATQCLAEIRNIGAAAMTAHRVLAAVINLIRAPTRAVDDERTAQLSATILPAIAAIGAAWPGRSAYLAYFRERGRYLAYRPAAQFGAHIAAALFPTDEAMRESLHDLALGSASPVQRCAAVTGLCQTDPGDQRTRDLAYRLASDPSEIVRQAALEMCSAHWPAEPDTLEVMRHATSDPHKDVRTTALHGLIAASGSDSAVRETVSDLARRDVDATVRGAAVTAVSKQWPDHADTRRILLTAVKDAAWSVRQTAIKALTARWAHESDVQAAIRAALRDADEDVRVAAVEGVAARSSSDPGVRDTLCAAFQDPHKRVRLAVVEALTSHWREDVEVAATIRAAEADPSGDVVLAALLWQRHRGTPETLASTVQHVVRNDSRADVRRAAVDAIAADWYDFPGSRQVVHEALGDPDPVVRGAATVTLARRWQAEPETFPAILDMTTDIDPAIREKAVGCLATRWTDRPEAKAALHVAARSDSWLAQQAAMEALAARWPDDSTTYTTLDAGGREAAGIVRQTALEAIASSRPVAEGRKSLEIAMRDPHLGTRQAASDMYAAALVDGWRHCSAVCEASADPIAAVRRVALTVMVTRWPDDPDTWTTVARVATDADADVREASLQAILAHRRHRPEAHERLVAATRDYESRIRSFALRALATIWPADPAVDEAVERGLRDSDPEVREAAVEVLTVREPESEATRLALCAASLDPLWGIRALAHQCLVARWRDHPESLATVVRAVRSDAESLRTAALNVLAVAWPDAPQTGIAMVRGSRDSQASVRILVLELARTRWPGSRRTARLIRRATRALTVDVQIAANDIGITHGDVAGQLAPRLDELVELTRHSSAPRRLDALRALVLQAPTEPDTIAAARRLVTDDLSDQVRTVALAALSRHAADDPPVLETVVDAARHHAAPVRRSAVAALAAVWATRPAARQALQRAAGDIASGARKTAVTALVQWFPDDPATLGALHRACYDPSWSVRQFAAEKLRAYWPDGPDTRARLELLARDTDYDVRSSAVQAAAVQWHDHPSVHALLDHVSRDPDQHIRRTTRQIIARSVRLTEPGLLDVLAAIRSPDWRIRYDALVALDERAPEHPEFRPALLDALRDPDPLVRWIALFILARQWPDQPETRQLVNAALDDPAPTLRYAAKNILARWWPDSDELFVACLRGLSDRTQWIRYWTVNAAAQWVERREARAALLAVALHDDQPSIREQALDALTRCWSWHGAVRAATESAMCSPVTDLREYAVLGAAATYTQVAGASAPATTAEAVLLKRFRADTPEKTRKDCEHALRISAVEQITARRPDDPDTYRYVLDATEDTCPGVRQAALEVLVTRWPEKPATRSAIRRAAEDSDATVRSFVLDAILPAMDPAARANSATLHRLLTDHDKAVVNRGFEAMVTMAPTVPAVAVAVAQAPDSGVYEAWRIWLAWRLEEKTA
ncbi:HEAT repeat domain-containing protein [Actinomycetes bacterium KLBMP 9797]